MCVGTARSFAIRTHGDVGGLGACIAGDAFDFGTVGFEDFATAAIKGVSSAEAFDCAVGLAALLLAGFAEAVGDFGVECVFTFDTDIFEAITDAARTECGVPIGVDIGCGESEAVAGNLRAEAEGVAPRAAMVIHLQLIEREGAADALGDALIGGATADHAVVTEVDVGNVVGLPDEDDVLVYRQAVAVGRFREMLDRDE